ncbi:MAG: ATP-binding protein [Chlamydiota bacterium]
MIPKKITKMKNFIGRTFEWNRLSSLGGSREPCILVVYGRRRVGKTELLEQVYADRNILKFEGIHGKSQKDQMAHVLWQLSEYAKNPLLSKLSLNSWTEVFKCIYDEIPDGTWTLYFEEIQWLADYQDDFVSELKFAWDNYFKNKENLLLILCGSSPSFVINQVIHSKSLYNRSQEELHLKEFSLSETAEYLSSRSKREVLDAYLSIGGIPEYLKRCKTASSVFLSLCENTFLPDSFFSKEYERIFVSSLANNKHYRSIIEFLSLRRFATREEILQHLKISTTGSLTNILKDMELCGFICKYSPYNLGETSLLTRFCISDNYLQFYYKFVKPISSDIQKGSYKDFSTSAIKFDTYQKWLGFAFERFCRNKHRLIATILGFHGVHYSSGAFFNRASQKLESGFQFDLVFDRDDKVITLCEIKYIQSKVGISVIEEFERKLKFFPNSKNKTIQKILIAPEGASDTLESRHYFDRVIHLEDLFAAEKR